MLQSNDKLKQVTSYTFSYGSESDSIDVNTLLLSQIHFSTVLNEIKNEVAPDANLSIRIKPLSKGSIPFDTLLTISWIEGLFNAIKGVSLDHATLLVSTFLNIILIRKELKGKKPTDIEVKDNEVIISTDDTKLIVSRQAYKIYEKNAIADQAMKKAFEAINKDEDITDVQILDEKKLPLVRVDRPEFENLIQPNEIFEEQTKTEPVRQETLTVYKVVFDKGYKWQFYLNGRKISAAIPDAFVDRLRQGERFGMGDTMVVEMETQKVYDPELDIYIDKDYKIVNVIKHTPRPKQSNLFDESGLDGKSTEK